MQNGYQDIDKSIRTMLEGAGVKPPRSVWKGVSSRLDAASLPADKASGAYLWPAFATALAALFLGLFLFQAKEKPEMGRDASARAILSSPEKIEIVLPGKPALLAETLRARKTEVIPAVPEEEKAPVVIAEEAEEQQLPEEKTTVINEPGHVTVKNPGASDVWTDEFEEDMPARRKSRPSMYLKGNVGGNESGISAAPGQMMLAPGNEKEGFSEIGESSYGVPFSVGLGVRFHVSKLVSVGTGLDYSLLTRTFSGKYNDPSLAEPVAGSMLHTLQYLGIPVNVYFDLLGTEKIHFYAYLGGEVEFCLSNRYTLFSNPDIIRRYAVRNPQLSAGGGIGVEFMLGRRAGFYIDPGVRYYFPGNQPKSVRTDKPLLVNLEAGLRFTF